MNVSYKARDFFYPIFSLLQQSPQEAIRLSEIAQRIIADLPLDRNSEFWALVRLKLKNRIRQAGVYMSEAGMIYLSYNHPTQAKGWQLTDKGLLMSGLSEEKFIKEIMHILRKKTEENKVQRKKNVFLPKITTRKKRLQTSNFSKNIVFYGPPATGKTSLALEKAIQILGLDTQKISDNKAELRKEQGNRLEIIVLHQNYGYEHFIEQKDAQGMVVDGVLKKIVQRAKAEYIANPSKPQSYVLLIDDLHRSEPMAVFGEAVSLIAADKRMGEENEMAVRLAQSGDLLVLPPNLYILGTMHLADIHYPIDSQFLQHFEMIPAYPRYDLLNASYTDFLKNLNKKMVSYKGIDYTFGHSYFLQSTDSLDFIRVLNRQIIPILSVYFQDMDFVREILQEALDKSESTQHIFEVIENENLHLEVIRVSW